MRQAKTQAELGKARENVRKLFRESINALREEKDPGKRRKLREQILAMGEAIVPADMPAEERKKQLGQIGPRVFDYLENLRKAKP